MGRSKRFKPKTLSAEEQQALHVVSFLMDEEADRLEKQQPDLIASEASRMTFEMEFLRLHEAMRAIAQWLRKILAGLL